MANKDFLDPYNLYGDTAEQPEQKQSLFNDLGNIISGINKTRQITRQDRELNDLKWKYTYDPNLTEEEQDKIAEEYNKKYEEMYKNVVEMQKNKKYLENAGSILGDVGKHALSAGSSLEAMQGQYEANLLGAGLGFLLTGGNPAGAAAGWKIANVPSAIRANVQDAEAGAYETWNDVLEKTGDIELARQAYYDALKPNLAWSAPAIAADIAIGSGVGKGLGGIVKGSKLAKQGGRLAKMMEIAENSRLAKGLGGIGESRFGKAIGNVANKLDIDLGEGAGAYVAGKLNNPLAGKVARAGVNLLAEDASEILQESEQGISQKLATERALHQYDPTKYTDNGELTVGKIADWVTSPEGRETILDTAVATTLTGSAPVAIGAFNRLNAGYNYKSNLQQADNIVNDIQRGAINIDNEVYSGIKNAIGAANGLDDSQTSALSDKDVIRQVLEDNTDRAISMGMNEKDANAFAVNETIKLLNGEVATTANLGYTTATTEAFAKQHGLDISNLTNMEKRRQQEQEARQKALTQAKEAHEGTITDDTTPYSEKEKEAGTGKPIEAELEQQKTTGQSGSSSLSNLFSNGFGQHWRVKQNAVDSNGNEYSDDIAILENSKTGRVVQVQKLDNGKISVLDITPEGATDENGKPVEASTKKTGRLSDKIGNKRVYFGTDADGIAALTKYMVSQENQTKTLKQEEDQANNEVKIADPNRRRVLVNSVHDLSNFYRNNKDLMDRDTFMMTARAMLAFGNGNVSIDLDLENQQAGKRGETTLPDVQNGVSKAIISLYSGADAMTVVHEFAHVGYDMMSANDKLLFNQMALASETEFVCNLLRANYPMFKNMEDSQILQLITKKDNATLVAANEVGAIRQTIDIINGSADAEQRQVACEERYAWEFSTWYAAGYTKGIAPDNQMHFMLDKTMHSLGKALNLISTIAERLQSPNWQAIQSDRSMVTMFENMNTRTFDTGGRDNVRRMYGGLRTQGAPQEQVQEGQQMPITEEQSGEQNQPSAPSEVFNVINTMANRQRREEEFVKQNKRMQPKYLRELNKLVNKGGNVTQDELRMVMGLSNQNYRQYANKVLAKTYPNAERLELLSYIDSQRGGQFADRIQKKMQVLQTKEDRERTNKLRKENDKDLDRVLFPTARKKAERESVEQTRNNRTSDKSVSGSLKSQVEEKIKSVYNKLVELSKKEQKNFDGYINANKDKFENVYVYKEALARFNRNRKTQSTKFINNALNTAARNSTTEVSRTEDGDSVYGTVNPTSVIDSLIAENEEHDKNIKEQRREEFYEKHKEEIDKIVSLLNEKKNKGGKSLQMFLVKETEKFKKKQVYKEALRIFNEQGEAKQTEQQEVAQQPQQVAQPVAQEQVQQEVQKPNPQPQPQPKQQPVEETPKPVKEVSQEVQEQPQQQAGEQTEEVERPKKGLPKKQFEAGLDKLKDHKFREGEGISQEEQLEIEKEIFGKTGVLSQKQFDELGLGALEAKENSAEEVSEEEVKETAPTTAKETAKEEVTNGKTEDSGRVGDLPLSQGTLQTRGSNGTSTSKQSVLQPRQRTELEGTETGHGESVPLLKDKNGKLIGRQIPKVNDKRASADTKKILNAAYNKEQPLELEGFVNIDNSTNQQGDKGVQIYNKLFGTNHEDGTKVYIHRSGKAGFAVDKDGFTTVDIKKGEKGLLCNVLTIARVTDGVDNIMVNGATQTEIAIYESAGYDATGCIKDKGKDIVVFRKNTKNADDIIKGLDGKDLSGKKVQDLPLFQNKNEYKNYKSIQSKSATRKGVQQEISKEKKNEIDTNIGEATQLFPSTSDKELQGVVDYVDDVLEKNKKATAKMSTERRYFFDTLKGAAEEELANRKKDVVEESDEGILNTIADAENLFEERQERLENGEEDTTTAQDILEKVGEVEEEVEPIDIEDSVNAIEEKCQQIENGEAKSKAMGIIKTLREDVKAYNGQKKTTENKGTIYDRVKNKLMELGQIMYDNTMEESDQDAEATVEQEIEKPSKIRPSNSRIDLTDYSYDNTHKIVTGDLIVDGVKHKGLTKEENITPTEVLNLINEIVNKYSTQFANVIQENMDISEEDKVRIGKAYRKLKRAEALIHERFSKGLYGQRNTKENRNLVYGHAASYLRNPQWNFRRGLLGRLKRIMDANLIYDYQYGFDEVDQKKKLSEADATKVRKSISNIYNKIENLKEKRKSVRDRKERSAIRRQIKQLSNELYAQQVRLWSHGLDYSGNGKFQDEHLQWAMVQWQKALRERQKQERKSNEDKDLTKRKASSVRRAQKRAAERQENATPVLDSEIATNEGQLQDEESWNNFFNGFKKNIEPLYKNAKKTLNGIEDVLKFRTLKEIVKLHKGGKDVEGMFNNVIKLIDEAQKNGHISEEEADRYEKIIKDTKRAFFKETGQDDKVAEIDEEIRKSLQEQTEDEDIEESELPEIQYAPSTKESRKRAKDLSKEIKEIAKPYLDIAGSTIAGGAITREQFENIGKVTKPLKQLIKKYFGTNIDKSQFSKAEVENLEWIEGILEKVKEVQQHWNQLKKGKFTPLLAQKPRTPQPTTTKTNKSTKTTTPTTKTTAPTTGSTIMSDETFNNMKKEIFDNLYGKPEMVQTMTVEKLVDAFVSISGQKLTDKQIKNLGNRLKSEQESYGRKTIKTNKSNTNQAQNKKTVSEKKTPAQKQEVAPTQGKPVSDKSFTNRMKNFVEHLKQGTESRTTVAKEGEVLTDKQQKLVDDALKKYGKVNEQKRAERKAAREQNKNKEQTENKTTQEKNPLQKALEKDEQTRKQNVQRQLDKLNNSKYVKNWIKGKVTKASDIISKLRNVQELKKIFDKGNEYRDGIDQACKEIQEVIGALERLGEITKEERKQIGDKMDAINYEVIKQAEAEKQNQQPAKTTASENKETILIHPVRGLTRTLLSDEEQLLKNHKYGDKNLELMKLLNDNVNNARTDEEKLDALILHNKHFFNLSMVSQEKELRKKLGRPKENKQNKSNTRKRSQETDTTIPETAVEENRDVYSITFTKDALAESKVKRDLANKYEKDDKYWKTERNADGSITFTRQKPLPHHTKNITYSGMNGKKVEKNKFDKLSQAWNWFADTMTSKWFNDNDAIKKLAAMVGATEAWMRFVVTKDIGSVASSAIERGIIKHNSKTHERTASLKSIANAVPKDKQWKFLEYCQAYRVLYDLAPKGIEQNMKPDEAQDLINEVENSEYGKLFKEQREKFVEYNKELLHVLVDGDIISEDFYQALVRDHPNFIPLSKDMSDFDSAADIGFTRKSLMNVNNPLHRIGSSDREMKNPLLEMQKRTFDYYQRAADNKAARIFIDEIVNKITTNAEGDEVLLNQAILHKLKPQYKKDGTIKDISDPNKGIFYVMKDGKKEFYQLSDASVYKALRSMSPEQMTQFGKFVRWALSRPAEFVRFFATFTPDFGFGNLIRDNGEAFLTSRHGFIPLYDSLWGMWQMYTDSEWFKEYNSQVGEMGTRMRESERIAIDSQTAKDKVKNSMFVSPFFTLNEYLEQGTRIGEYKNARMGYKGTLGRLTDSRSTTLAEADKSGRDKTYAAYRSKDITLDFQQHGEWSKEINRYIPFFNASMQGLYKVLNFIDEAVHNKEGMRAEFLLKASLISFLAISAGIHGAGDDDYEEAPDWEKDNYYVLGNGLRIPKDQVLGKLIGNSMELLGYQMAKGEIKLDEAGKQLVHDIKNAVIPDNLMPAFMNLAIGVAGDYDMFRQKHITPEYLQNKISYLQKDLSTSQVSADASWAIYQLTGWEIGAKKINFAFDNLFSNTMKYVNRMYDFVKEEATGKKANQKVGHMYLDADSKWSSEYLTSNTGSNLMDTTLDIMKMMVGKKFIQNQTSFKSVENFNEEYRRLQRLSSDPEAMTKQEQKLFTQFYEPAMKKIKANQKKLSEINKNESWDKTQKLEKARPIILKNIEIARWANSKSKA